jgi:hypothetical protein
MHPLVASKSSPCTWILTSLLLFSVQCHSLLLSILVHFIFIFHVYYVTVLYLPINVLAAVVIAEGAVVAIVVAAGIESVAESISATGACGLAVVGAGAPREGAGLTVGSICSACVTCGTCMSCEN